MTVRLTAAEIDAQIKELQRQKEQLQFDEVRQKILEAATDQCEIIAAYEVESHTHQVGMDHDRYASIYISRLDDILDQLEPGIRVKVRIELIKPMDEPNIDDPDDWKPEIKEYLRHGGVV